MTQRQLVEMLFVSNKAVSKFILQIDEHFLKIVFCTGIIH